MTNIDNTHILSLDAITSDINDEMRGLDYTTLYGQKKHQLSLSCIALKEATLAIQRYLDIIDSDSDHDIE